MKKYEKEAIKIAISWNNDGFNKRNKEICTDLLNFPHIRLWKNKFSILHPYNNGLYHTADSIRFSYWLVNSGYKWCLAFLILAMLYPVNAMASNYTYTMAFQAFLKWVPLLVKSGFVLNIIISFLAMMIGTAMGVILGLAQVSQYKYVRIIAASITCCVVLTEATNTSVSKP